MVATLLLITGLLLASVSDLRTRTIPDSVHLLLLLSGAAAILFDRGGLIQRASGFIIVGVMLLTVSFIDTMGGGDIKMGACMGFSLGLMPALTALLIACSLGAIAGLLLQKDKKRTAIPLAPFFSAGCMAVLLLNV